ncbi:MAG: lyase domain protein repeat-containing protein [Verrucomicrobiales bacterium]|nr:lyase domain protein repeat-containing protein [Verrucomicrobiales bacterium]
MVLARKVKDPDPEVRQEALEELGDIGSRGDVKTIAAALKDERSSVRRAAAQALKKIGDPRAVEALANGLADDKLPGPGWQTEFVVALESFNDPRAVEPLITALNHPQPKVRRAAASALGKLKNPLSLEPLIIAVKDPDPDVAREAGDALAKLGQPAVPYLLKILESERGYSQNIAAEALGIAGDPVAIPALIEALKEKDSYLQITVAKALARFNDPRVIDPLIEALDESSTAAFFYGVREEAETSLIKMGATAVQPLIEALQSRFGQSRVFIAKMLGQIPDPRSFDPLLQILNDENADVRKAVIYSLAAIDKRRAIESVLPMMDDPDAPTRRVAAETLVKLGWSVKTDADQAKHFAAMGKYADALALGDVGVDALLNLLHDQDDGVRKTVCRVLGRTGNPVVVQSLQRAALEETNPDIQRNIVEALEAAGAPAIPALVMLLESGNWNLVKVVSKCLTGLKWRPESPKQTLLHALATGNADVAVDAAELAPEILTSAMRSNDKGIQSTAATVRLTLENMRVLKELSQGISPRRDEGGTHIVNAVREPNNPRGRALQRLFEHLSTNFANSSFTFDNLPPIDEEFITEIRLMIQKIQLSGGQVPSSEQKMAQSDLLIELVQLGLLVGAEVPDSFRITDKGRDSEIILD